MNKNRQTLSESEVRGISSRYIHGVDKFHRMYEGISSSLEKYEKNILYLRIENTEKQSPSNYGTALKIARSWVQFNEELSCAKGFVVSFYKTLSTGFILTANDVKNNKELVKGLTEKFNSANKQKEHDLINIFSGVFSIQRKSPIQKLK